MPKSLSTVYTGLHDASKAAGIPTRLAATARLLIGVGLEGNL